MRARLGSIAMFGSLALLGCADILGYDDLRFVEQKQPHELTEAAGEATAGEARAPVGGAGGAAAPAEPEALDSAGMGGGGSATEQVPPEVAPGSAGNSPILAAAPHHPQDPSAPGIACTVDLAGMACIGGAKFFMGSSEPYSTWHAVTVRPFYLDKTEVTVDAYDECLRSGSCFAPFVAQHQPNQSFDRCNEGNPERGQHPINCVNWDAATRYCAWRGLRLPTEEEWHYATRRGTLDYPWGDETASSKYLNLAGDEFRPGVTPWGDDGFVGTAPVGSFPLGATADGIVDLLGNVWELTSSRACAFPSGMCTSCLPGEACADACDACVTTLHAVRGGSWAEADFAFALEHRGAWGEGPSGGASDYIGFRCARSANLTSGDP